MRRPPTLPLLLSVALIAALALGACDGAGPELGADPDAVSEPEPEPEPEPELEPEPEPEPDPTRDLPEGPYGTGYLEIIDPDLGFYDPWSGLTHKVGDLYQHPTKRAVLIASAAGWCVACMYEAWDLVEVYDKYADDGLEVFFTLYEDAMGRPLWDDPDRFEPDFIFMNEWRDNLGVFIRLPRRMTNYPLFVDVGFKLEPYFDKAATPLTLIVRTHDLRIIYSSVGYGAGSIEHVVKTALYSN